MRYNNSECNTVTVVKEKKHTKNSARTFLKMDQQSLNAHYVEQNSESRKNSYDAYFFEIQDKIFKIFL